MVCAAKLPEGTALELQLGFPGGEAPASVDGDVVWQMPQADGMFVTGIQFQNISAACQEQIARFITVCARQVEEKREFVRCALETDVSYRRQVDTAEGGGEPRASHAVARSIDIGRGGMKMVAGETFDLGAILRVTFSLPRDRTFISCASEVIWAQREPSGGCRIGVRFLDLSQRDADRIWAFVTQHCAFPGQREGE